MPIIDKNRLIKLQNCSRNIRNICILAHVDHGKTTLADSLVASNGIISQRMAGKLRYMDSRSDEQERGITMKSSSISLFYENVQKDNEYLINLIDSPGHVDFSSEVSTAVRLCDGAIVVVDVIEGVCPQTRICLKQAYEENLKPILVLNKIDRLIVERAMLPLDAYIHLQQVLEQVNAVVGNIFASDVMSREKKSNQTDYISGLEDSDDSDLYFSPEQGNVIFCSAIDGWAFVLKDFARFYASKIGISSDDLEKMLWGNYYFNSKEKKPVLGAQEKAKKPLFVQFILENIWNLYDVILRKDKEKLPNIIDKLGLRLTARDLRQSDPRLQLQAIFCQWLPIERSVLEMVVTQIPPPECSINDTKAERLMCSLNQNFLSMPDETQRLKEDFKQSNPASENIIVFISKMVAVNKSLLPHNRPKPLTEEEMEKRRMMARQRHNERIAKLNQVVEDVKLTDSGDISTVESGISIVDKEPDEIKEEERDDENDDVFVAFARVYSGTLKRGAKIFVLSPKHDPRTMNPVSPLDSPYIVEATVEHLYLLMGRDLEDLDEIPAGNIVGIGGLEEHVLKTATLSNTPFCPSFCELTLMATPILRVAIEPKSTVDMAKLVKGLKLLNQADACVQVIVQENGEHVLLTLGEVHLERCVFDIENQYAKVKVSISTPIVPFRETIVPAATVDMVNEAIVLTKNHEEDDSRMVTILTANHQHLIKLIAIPLDEEVTNLLENNNDILRIYSKNISSLSERTTTAILRLKEDLIKAFKNSSEDELKGNDIIHKIWSLGPRKCGSNILLNLSDFKHNLFWNRDGDHQSNVVYDPRHELESSFVNGFQMATFAGPLCEEPMQGVCFAVHEWTINLNTATDKVNQSFGPISGQIMSAVKEGCRKAFQNQPQRLVSPMYSCSIVVNADVLGKMYAVIGRRHGRILSADLTQGSGNFLVTARIPVIESFNFAQEIRKQTSGLACPQLMFSHWEIIDIDPFWVPSTDEEYLHFGDKADTQNRAKLYMDSVRKRKGLAVEEKLVEHAEKQRTLSKKK